MNVLKLRSELSRLYDLMSRYYLNTSMLSVPHIYMERISDDPDEVGAVAFLSAIYDFQMRVGLIRSRFLYVINYLMERGMSVLNLLNNDVISDLLNRLTRSMGYFHRFDPKGRMLKPLLKAYRSIRWEEVIASADEGSYDVAIAKHLWGKLSSMVLGDARQYLRLIPRNPNSPHKRLNLFLRWMVRSEYPDLGLWSDLIDRKSLIVPLGTEISRTFPRVFKGLVKDVRRTRKNAINVTKDLSKVSPDDPVKYDFVISRPAILGICNKDVVGSYCWVCPLNKVCRLAGMVNYEEQKAFFKERLRRLRIIESGSARHNRVLRAGATYIFEKYVKPLRLLCSSDRSIDHGLRPDLICDQTSSTMVIAEAKTSTRAKDAPIQLKTYIDEVRNSVKPNTKLLAFLIYGKHDPIELQHAIEVLRLSSVTRSAELVEIILVKGERAGEVIRV